MFCFVLDFIIIVFDLVSKNLVKVIVIFVWVVVWIFVFCCLFLGCYCLIEIVFNDLVKLVNL